MLLVNKKMYVFTIQTLLTEKKTNSNWYQTNTSQLFLFIRSILCIHVLILKNNSVKGYYFLVIHKYFLVGEYKYAPALIIGPTPVVSVDNSPIQRL